MKLLLDANFLVLPFQFNIEIFDEFERLVGGEFELYTLERTYHEARDLRDGRYAKLVKKLIDLKDIDLINTEADQSVDDQLVTFARRGYVICTNDSDVRRKLDIEDLPQIYLRQRNHLEGKNLPRR